MNRWKQPFFLPAHSRQRSNDDSAEQYKHRKTRGRKLKTLSAVVKDIIFGLIDEAIVTTADDTVALPHDLLTGKHFLA